MPDPIKAQIYSGMWIKLPANVKERIADIFKIPKNGMTHVFDSKVVQDGYLDEDLARLNLKSINEYLMGRELEISTDLFSSWNALVELIANDLEPKPKQVEPVKPNMNVNVHVTVDETGKVESVKTNEHVKKAKKGSKSK